MMLSRGCSHTSLCQRRVRVMAQECLDISCRLWKEWWQVVHTKSFSDGGANMCWLRPALQNCFTSVLHMEPSFVGGTRSVRIWKSVRSVSPRGSYTYMEDTYTHIHKHTYTHTYTCTLKDSFLLLPYVSSVCHLFMKYVVMFHLNFALFLHNITAIPLSCWKYFIC